MACGCQNGLDSQVDLVADDLSKIKRPVSPLKYLDFDKEKYSHIVKVKSQNEEDESNLISVNYWLKNVKRKNEPTIPSDTIPINFEHDVEPWDLITTALINDKSAESKNWK